MSPLLVGGMGALGLAGLVYAVGWERWWVEVTRREVPLAGLPEALAGVTIAHLSDIHYGPFVPGAFIRRAVERVNALSPDLVALTGDLVDRRPTEIEPVVRELSRLRAPLGVWAVLGGHDVRASERRFVRAFAGMGIRLLRNEAAAVGAGPNPLWVVGTHDNSEYYLDRLDAALAAVPAGAPTLLLSHSPDIAPEASARGIGLVLSGHTHGGQICLPFYGPLVTESRFWRTHARGLTRAGNTWIYTCRGLGTVRLPARFCCRPEIALHRLVRAPKALSNELDEHNLTGVAHAPAGE